jgi:NADH dehydrogenase
LQAGLLGILPGELMSRDNFDSMAAPNVASGRLPGLADLGISPALLEADAERYLGRKSHRSYLDHLRRDAHP